MEATIGVDVAFYSLFNYLLKIKNNIWEANLDIMLTCITEFGRI